MKKKQRTLRFKLTFMTVCVMSIMCIILTSIALSASNIIVKAKIATPAQSVSAKTSTTVHAEDLQPAIPSMEAQRSFNVITIYAMFFVVAAGGVFVFFFVKRELSPLEVLSEQVQNLNAENLSIPITVHATGDEIERVSVAVNDMAARVSDAYLMQKNFSASAAHELRTPLASMQSKIEVFRMKKDRTAEEYEQLVQTIDRNTQRLSDLVMQLLEFTNQAELDMTQHVNLRTIVEEAVIDLETLAREKQIKISVLGDATILGNDCMLQRAVFNILQNAVKYNQMAGTVTVSLCQNEQNVVLSVTDTGIGIPAEMRDRIFELFFRVDRSRSREIGGNGLGLSIVKRIVTQHGGTILVTDNAPHGTCMTLIFPIIKT